MNEGQWLQVRWAGAGSWGASLIIAKEFGSKYNGKPLKGVKQNMARSGLLAQKDILIGLRKIDL